MSGSDKGRSKYQIEGLLPALRYFADARNRAVEQGLLTDNGGAIHSVERILDILSLRVCYPHVSHYNSLKRCPTAHRSPAAHQARLNGERVEIEHVLPKRAYAQLVCEMIAEGVSDAAVVDFIHKNFRLVLLTPEERVRLDSRNRSNLTLTRLEDAGIRLVQPERDRTGQRP